MEEEKKPNAGQGLGIAGLVLGVVAIPMAIFPCTILFAFILGLLGTIFGAVALSQANKANAGKGLPISGLVTSVVALLIIIIWVLFIAKNVKDDWKQFKNPLNWQWSNDSSNDSADTSSFNNMEDVLDQLENADSTMNLSDADFDNLMAEYEKVVNDYLKKAEKVKNGSLSDIPDVTEAAIKVTALSAKLLKALPNMDAAQQQKFEDIQKKFEETRTKFNN